MLKGAGAVYDADWWNTLATINNILNHCRATKTTLRKKGKYCDQLLIDIYWSVDMGAIVHLTKLYI